MLTGSLPASFSQLRSLVEFKCASNQLEGTIPKLTQLQMAQEYDLGSNKFSGPFPIDMIELPRLVAFTVSKNQLTGTLLNNFPIIERWWLQSSSLRLSHLHLYQ